MKKVLKTWILHKKALNTCSFAAQLYAFCKNIRINLEINNEKTSPNAQKSKASQNFILIANPVESSNCHITVTLHLVPNWMHRQAWSSSVEFDLDAYFWNYLTVISFVQRLPNFQINSSTCGQSWICWD